MNVDHLKLVLNKQRTHKDIDQVMADDLAAIAQEMLGSLVNGALQKGIDIPRIHGWKLIRPVLRFYDHMLVLNTDLHADDTFLAIVAG